MTSNLAVVPHAAPDVALLVGLRADVPRKDVSSLLTVEVFLLTVRLFYLRWGNRK